MKQIITHPWTLTEAEAFDLQCTLARNVERNDRLNKIRSVAGVDVAYDKHSDRLIAAVVVLDSTSLAIIEKITTTDVVRFPYIPGLFSFRELPPIAMALHKLQNIPDLIICDGQGIAHPRRFGLACHIGILFDVPTIGCGKTRLLGAHDEVGKKRGSYAPIIDNNEIIGNALRTQDKIKPVYVSTGHRVSLPTACDWILHLCTKHRLPDTTRISNSIAQNSINN